MLRMTRFATVALGLACLAATSLAGAAPWVAADWAGKEPQFPAGSLYYHTNEYPTCPVLFRTTFQVADKPVAFAGLQVTGSQFAYVFLNGKQIESMTPKDVTTTFAVELADLKSGPNVLVISTKGEGFAMDGGISYQGGNMQRIASATAGWKVQKFAPLTILEDQKCLKADFDDSQWFSVKETDGQAETANDQMLEYMCGQTVDERLTKLDKDAAWRLSMLANRGIAVVDLEAHGWAGAEQIPAWVRELADVKAASAPAKAPGAVDAKAELMSRFEVLSGEDINRYNQARALRVASAPAGAPGAVHARAEALARYVVLSDEAINLANQAQGLKTLKASEADIAACASASEAMKAPLAAMEQALKAGKFEQALAEAPKAQAASDAARKGRLINRLNRCLDNKFGWFDTAAMLDSDITGWGLRFGSPVATLTSPLSPAALVTLKDNQLVLQGWDKLPALKVYNKPATVGPVCLWAVIDGKLTSLKPAQDGTVYDSATSGKLTENWVLLVNDMAKGGQLPIELVMLQSPTKISFKSEKDKGAIEVAVAFEKAGAQLFILRPMKEWRGFLGTARDLTASPLNEAGVRRFVEPCRLWSRALLNYPVSFSEAVLADPQDKLALNVADVYNYLELKDQWNTKPLRLAPLPALASYGLMTQYPGLKVTSEQAKTIGSSGIWGDNIAVADQNMITYRVPLDPIKRYAGFTPFCFGDSDIGGPGGLTEIQSVKATGATSFRPQHNQTGPKAITTVKWCMDNGLQNVFNTDEKWVSDVVAHYASLAEQCKDFPPDAVAYDLLNEPETRDPRAYGALMKKITAAIRQVDKTHLIYVETMPPWGPGAAPFPRNAFETLEPTGDKLTVYSFHDYEYRLEMTKEQRKAAGDQATAETRWPDNTRDARDILTRWIPAFRYSIDQRTAIHIGEFGALEQADEKDIVFTNPCTTTLMLNYMNIFDQFGWHWHYYANRGTTRVRLDGSMQESYVQQAVRQYFARGTFNAYRQDK